MRLSPEDRRLKSPYRRRDAYQPHNGPKFDTNHAALSPLEDCVKHIWTENLPCRPDHQKERAAERHPISVPARLTWKDQRGTTRFASVITRNVSEYGVYVECQSAISIPLYRLVQFQLERETRESDSLPGSLRQGRILSAVYRISPPKQRGAPHGLALRLIVDPRRRMVAESTGEARATA